MTWSARVGWAILALVTLAIALAPDLVTLPRPSGALVINRATFISDSGNSREVALPHAVRAQLDNQPHLVRYVTRFDLRAVPDQSLFLYIPMINRRVSLTFGGETFQSFESSAYWTGPWVSGPVFVRMPRLSMVAGENVLTLTVETGPYAIPTYVSEVYLGSEALLAPHYKLRLFIDSQLKVMAFAAHALLGIGLIFAYFFRPSDPLFSWLATLNVVSLIASVALFTGFHPAMQGLLPVFGALATAASPLFIGFALASVHVRPPKALKIAVIAIPLLLLPLALTSSGSARIGLAAGAACIMIVGLTTGTIIFGWGAFLKRSVDAGLLFPSSFLMAWFGIHDFFITVTAPAHGYNLLFAYPRPLMLAFITVVLMRRMGASLDQLDGAKERLVARLAEREAELASLHLEDKVKTARLVRDRERERLTHDLHDGISGHLVSIIAMSERAGDETKPIEQAARDALSDLRLVIYSLDLGDSELPLALANFRERLAPQLLRMGIELEWSTANLPEVRGVTPGNALAVLRIVQEAITNAVKHGPARKISVRGAAASGDRAMITIENDGSGVFEPGRKVGRGLANMRRRAETLQGGLTIDSDGQMVNVTLLLPLWLPEFGEESFG